MRVLRLVGAARVLGGLLLGLFTAWTPACGGGGGLDARPAPLKVLTRNVYYGADLGPAIQAVSEGDPEAIVMAVSQVWADVQATSFAARADALADEIEREAPDLVGLQEAALWRVQRPSDAFSEAPTPAAEVAFDVVALLLEELALRGMLYEVVVVAEGFDVELPMLDGALELADLRLTDREVILARRDLGARGFTLREPTAGRFTTNLVLESGFEALRGWASVDVDGPQGALRFVTTHLEAEVAAIRDAQAAELLGGVLATERDVVLVGDFNDDAFAPDLGGAYEMLLGAGFGDVWLEVAGAAPGATCCFDALLTDADAPLTERLDLVLLRGSLEASVARIVGADPGERVAGLWASDHAGLVAHVLR